MKFYESFINGVILSKRYIESEDDLHTFLRGQLSSERVEHFCLCLVGNNNEVLAWVDTDMLAQQTTISTHMPILSIAKVITMLDAKGVYLVHNHPSGNPEPSNADIEATGKIKSLCATLEVGFLGHYLVAGNTVIDITDRELA